MIFTRPALLTAPRRAAENANISRVRDPLWPELATSGINALSVINPVSLTTGQYLDFRQEGHQLTEVLHVITTRPLYHNTDGKKEHKHFHEMKFLMLFNDNKNIILIIIVRQFVWFYFNSTDFSVHI